MKPVSAILPCGQRLHLQHGPIDLIVDAEGEREHAFEAAHCRFQSVLQELVEELELLRQPLTSDCPYPNGQIARRMDKAARAHARVFVTRMAAVAGAVADDVLSAMRDAASLNRASVNNGGDIAIFLGPGQTFNISMSGLEGQELGRIALCAEDRIGGVATSGRGGRSLSLGIADSVTVLAQSAAQADVAATLIANAVDLPDHPAIHRVPAIELRDDTDLGTRLVPVSFGALTAPVIRDALQRGLDAAEDMRARGLISAAHLSLQGHSCQIGPTRMVSSSIQRIPEYA
ncbi:UPF0280 family protein [Ruegeria arenilitoris]|uniref:UPF0280 family protein n=1 Tax=Ruegeria arenilitoris TaxID=1173585 RepID=UPI00147B52A0|nr:UPF0280 family protein [Ruegeria arenilitoris]